MLRTYILLILLISPCSFLHAEQCPLADEEFPEDDCSFQDLGIDIKTLRFGKIDDVSDNNRRIFFGAVRFDVTTAQIFDTDDSDCNFDDEVLDDSNNGDEVAFIVSETDPRVIEQLWLLDCTINQAR